MRTLEELIRKRKEKKLTYDRLSMMTGIPVPTLQKIFSGKTASPRYHTLEKLEEALFGAEPGADVDASGILRESAPLYSTDGGASERRLSPYLPYKPQGTYTVADLELLPEEERFELIDGVMIRLESPSLEHQQLVMFLGRRLEDMAEEMECDCLVLCAPFDVQLDRDEKTMVQPDVLVICNENNVNEKRGIGAPDLCIEILSPSTRSKDQLLKKYKYERAGVREFWVVDPEAEQVIVYRFDRENSGGAEESRYSFEDKVPVGICPGGHSVDFAERVPAFIRRRRQQNGENDRQP